MMQARTSSRAKIVKWLARIRLRHHARPASGPTMDVLSRMLALVVCLGGHASLAIELSDVPTFNLQCRLADPVSAPVEQHRWDQEDVSSGSSETKQIGARKPPPKKPPAPAPANAAWSFEAVGKVSSGTSISNGTSWSEPPLDFDSAMVKQVATVSVASTEASAAVRLSSSGLTSCLISARRNIQTANSVFTRNGLV